jgi:hypothetical protein
MTRRTALGGSVLTALFFLVSACAGGQAATPTPEPLLFPTFTATTAAPTQAPAVPTVIVQLSQLKVTNTGGEGAMLRKTPGGDAIRAWMDGTIMQVVGSPQTSAGRTWQNVKDPSGNTGWMAADFLTAAPAATGTPAAAGTARPATSPVATGTARPATSPTPTPKP